MAIWKILIPTIKLIRFFNWKYDHSLYVGDIMIFWLSVTNIKSQHIISNIRHQHQPENTRTYRRTLKTSYFKNGEILNFKYLRVNKLNIIKIPKTQQVKVIKSKQVYFLPIENHQNIIVYIHRSPTRTVRGFDHFNSCVVIFCIFDASFLSLKIDQTDKTSIFRTN